MAVFRVERTGDYTVMSNFHLKDKRLSLKAKGLLSQMLSLPDDWDYTLSGLSYINRESKDAIRSAVNELETAGYIRRRQTTDASGKFAANEYTIFERPIEGEPMLDKPLSENPITVNPSAVNPLPENPTQLNTKKSNTQKQNTHGSNTDSIPFRETAAVIPPERKGRDAMSVTEMLNQAGGDRQILAKQLGISTHQLSYVTHSGEGEGLLFYGSTILPFVDHFPKNTELYRIMTTKPQELKKEDE